MHRLRILASLIVGLALLAPGTARAAYVDFVATPLGGHANSVSLGQTLTGTDIGLTSLFGLGASSHSGVSFPLADARLDFQTGTLTGTDAQGDLFFGPGGHLTITIGSTSIDVPTGVAFTGQFTGMTELKKEGDGTFHILAGGFAGAVSEALAAFFGLAAEPSSIGAVSLNLGGSGLTPISGDVTIDPNPVPEPASLGLIAAGLAVGLALRRRLRPPAS